jgi:hypothetical protein
MGCPGCGYPVRKGIDRCPQCGRSLVSTEEPFDEALNDSSATPEKKKEEKIIGGTVIQSAAPGRHESLEGRKIVGLLVTYDRLPEGEVFFVREGRNYVGRNESDDIHIQNDTQVSGKHFSILYRTADRKFKFRDEQSSNGTFVNNVLTDEGTLHHADVIRIGSTRLRFIEIPSLDE